VIRWENGAPVEVTYDVSGVTALGGTEAGLSALLTGDVIIFDGSSWQVSLDPPGNGLLDLTVLSDAIYAVSFWSPGPNDIRSHIYRYDGVEWVVDFETGPNTSIYQLEGRPGIGVWVIGHQTHEASNLDAEYSTPVLLRRGASGWESLDSTHFGRYRPQSLQCEGEVCSLSNMWVDLEGRAHVTHPGQGIFVHDGTQSWMEDSPIPSIHLFWSIEASPDGTVFAIATPRSPEDGPAFLWVHDGLDWRSTPLGSDFRPRGLSAFDGGAIITACELQGSAACKVGRVLRAWPDGTVQEIRSVALTGDTLW